jgi:hypothetical protein
VDLAQLVRFLVVKLTHSNLNSRFDMSAIFMTNYFSVGDDVSVDSKTLLVTDFVNLKTKPTQSFEDTHRCKMCVHIFIMVNAYTCMSIYIFTVFLTKVKQELRDLPSSECNFVLVPVRNDLCLFYSSASRSRRANRLMTKSAHSPSVAKCRRAVFKLQEHDISTATHTRKCGSSQ